MHGLRPVWALLILAFCIHFLGRAAAMAGTGEFDSFLYSVAAYQAWQSGSSADALVPDKPAGQAVLTGWSYRLWWGLPSRLVLVPVESAFLLGGLAALYLSGARLFTAVPAAAAAMAWALAVGCYSLRDGFNLNECYAAAAVLGGAAAHLSIRRAGLRGLVRGVLFGLALTIKQSAAAAVAACVLDGLIRHARAGQPRKAVVSVAASAVGLVLGMVPVVFFLASHGWLGAHLDDLAKYSGMHAGRPFTTLPNAEAMAPLGIVAWWLAMAFAARSASSCDNSTGLAGAEPRRPGVPFLLTWLAFELGIATAMLQPRAHYYIMVAGPACLLGAAALTAWWRAVQTAPLTCRPAALVWMISGSALLTVWALLPLASTLGARTALLSRSAEQDRFAHWLEHWTANPPGPHFRGILDGS